MEKFAELIRRFLEIQSDGMPRSAELIADDEQLMSGLQKRYRELLLAPGRRVGRGQRRELVSVDNFVVRHIKHVGQIRVPLVAYRNAGAG